MEECLQGKQLISTRMQGNQWLYNANYGIKKLHVLLKIKSNGIDLFGIRYSLPKHRFIMWICLQDRLKTRARLKSFGVIDSYSCLLCQQHVENINHLFFTVLLFLDVRWRNRGLHQLCRWIVRGRYSGSKFKKDVILTVVVAIVYLIWINKNLAL